MSGRPAVAAAVVLAASLGACGGDDGAKGPKPPTAKELKQAYVARADQACARFRRERRGERAPESANRTLRQARDARQDAAKTLDELRRLKPPAQDRAVLDRYFALIEQQVRVELPRLERAARRRDRAAAQRAFARLQTRGAEASALAQEYGFKVCGQRAAGGGGGATTQPPDQAS